MHGSEHQAAPPNRTTIRALNERHGEKLRFLVVGGWNTLFGYTLFTVLLLTIGPALQSLADSTSSWLKWIGEHYYLAVQWVAWALAVPHSTITLKLLVFRSKGHWLGEIARSYLVYAPLQVVSFGLLWLFSAVAGLHPLFGQLLTSAIAAVLSYAGNKRITFRMHNG